MKYYILFFIGLILSGCGQKAVVEQELSRVKSYMHSQPDSALSIIERIDPSNISRRSIRARYSLLYSQALDKNYIDTDNDSLIHPAVKYFEHHGTNEDKYLAFYYLGRVQCNAQDYTNAVISYTQAKDYAEKQDDHYFLGLIYSQLGDIYSTYYNYPSSIDAYNQAHKQYCQTTNKAHQHFALLDLATAYLAAKQYEQSMLILTGMLEDPEIQADISLHAGCLSLMATNYDHINQPSKAKKTLLSIQNELNEPFRLNHYLIFAHAYSAENKLDSMNLCLDVARQCASTDKEKSGISFTEYKINKDRNNYTNAFECLEKCMFIQDSLTRLTLNQSVISAQRDYYEDQSEFTAYQLKVNKRYGILLFCIFVLIITGLIAYFLHMRKIKNMEIAEYMAMAYRIQDTLNTVQVDMHDKFQTVQESMQKKDKQHIQMANLIQHLFKEKFELIDRLGNTYYERQNTKSERDAIFNDVKAEIKKLGSDKGTKQKLEQIVNACKDDVMLKLRNQMTEFKEEDFELFCYVFAGFSSRAISIFTQEKVESLYTRKSRLKSKILKSDAPDRDFFIKEIS